MQLLRSCLVTSMTLIAFGFVAAALWFGITGLIWPEEPTGAPATATVGSPRLTTPATAASSGAVPAPTTARPGASPSVRPTAPVAVSPAAPPTAATAAEMQLARLTDAQLTTELRQAVTREQNGLQIDEPRVRVTGGKVELTGRLGGLLPLPIDVRIVARVDVRAGRPVVVVERVEGVGVPLPAPAARRLEALINAFSLVPLPDGVVVTRVEAGEGVLTVYGHC